MLTGIPQKVLNRLSPQRRPSLSQKPVGKDSDSITNNLNASERDLNRPTSSETMQPFYMPEEPKATQSSLHSDPALNHTATKRSSTNTLHSTGLTERLLDALPSWAKGSAGGTPPPTETHLPGHTLAANPKVVDHTPPPEDLRHTRDARTATHDRTKARETNNPATARPADTEDLEDYEKVEVDSASRRLGDEHEPEVYTTHVNAAASPLSPGSGQLGEGPDLEPGANTGYSNAPPRLEKPKTQVQSNAAQPVGPSSTSATKTGLPAGSSKESTAPILPEVPHVEPFSFVPDTTASAPAEGLVKRSLAFAGGLLKARKIKDDDINPDDVVIVVMGPTGAGKSSFISIASALDDKDTVQVGHTLNSCTSQIAMYRISCPLLLDKDIILVDTPGFDDTHVSDADTLKSVSKWLEARYKADTKLAGLLYFHRISDNRMAGTPLKNLRMFQKLCGEESLKKVTLVTTMWDMVESEEVGQGRLKELSEDPKFWKGMIEHGSEVKRFEYSFPSALSVLERTTAPIKKEHDESLKKELQADPVVARETRPKSKRQQRAEKKRVANASRDGSQTPVSPGSSDARQVKKGVQGLRLQEELVDEGKELRATAAGKVLFSKLQELVDKRQKVLDRLKEEIDLGGKEGFPESVLVSLTKELEELQKEFDVAHKELESLKITMGDRLAGWLRAGLSIGGLGSLLRKLGRKKSVINDTPAK